MGDYKNWKDSQEIYKLFKIIFLRPNVTTGEIIELTGKSNAAISEQLKFLFESGLIGHSYEGKMKAYSINDTKVMALLKGFKKTKKPLFANEAALIVAAVSFNDLKKKIKLFSEFSMDTLDFKRILSLEEVKQFIE